MGFDFTRRMENLIHELVMNGRTSEHRSDVVLCVVKEGGGDETPKYL